MVLVIGIFTVFMVLDCLFLVLLVLMQLPKKEAGAGLAFGGAATDALFGAGSGNFLTKATKYAAITFFCFAVMLSVMQNHYSHREGSDFQNEVEKAQQNPQMPAVAAPSNPSSSQSTLSTNSSSTNLLNFSAPTNAAATTNSTPAPSSSK